MIQLDRGWLGVQIPMEVQGDIYIKAKVSNSTTQLIIFDFGHLLKETSAVL